MFTMEQFWSLVRTLLQSAGAAFVTNDEEIMRQAEMMAQQMVKQLQTPRRSTRR